MTTPAVPGAGRRAGSPALDAPAVSSAAVAAASWLEFQQRHLRVPGVQAALALGGELLLSSAWGVADESTGALLTPRHLFRVASHSKTFTATAVLRLREAGRLGLDDAAGRWVPALAEAGSPLAGATLRSLLGHGSGTTRDGEGADWWQGLEPFPDTGALLELMGGDVAVLGPEERFKYSNIAYSLLGMVIEAAAGAPYAEVLQRDVLDRVGLADTRPCWDAARADEHAAGHSALSYADARVVLPHLDTRAMDAATGFSSTAEDLCRWAEAHCAGDERLLGEASRRLAQREEWRVEGTEDAYGLGFAVTRVGQRRLVGHGGGYPGHITQTLFDPEAHLAVSVLTNAIDGPASALARGVVALVDLAASGEPDPVVGGAEGAGGDGDLAVLDRFTGRFADLWGVHDVVRLGRRLVLLDPSAPEPTASVSELRVVDEATLRITDAPGYGSRGELLRLSWDGEGQPAVLAGAGATSWRYPDWVARRGWEATSSRP